MTSPAAGSGPTQLQAAVDDALYRALQRSADQDVSKLSYRARRALELRLDGYSLAEVAEFFMVSKDAIRQLESEHTKKIGAVIPASTGEPSPLLHKPRDAGHAPQEATNARTGGSKRTTGSGISSSGEDDPPSSERVCARDDCNERVVRTGSRGPWPTRCPGHRRSRKREGWRKRKRKSRGAQWVLAEWTKGRPLTDQEHLRRLRDRRGPIHDHGLHELTYSIVNLDLSRERDPEDKAQALLEDFVTQWLVECEGRAA